MAMDVSTLVVKVESKGIDTTSKSLDGLGKSAEAAEKYVQSLMDRMSKASAPVQAIINNMNNLRSAMNGAIPTNSITAATTEFKKMSEELRKITDGLGKGVGKGVTVNIKEIGDGSKEAVKGVESLNQSLAKGQNVFQSFGKELYHIRNLLGGTMLAHAMLEAAKASVTLADSWTLANAKLMIFVGSATMAAHAQERLYQVSQELRVPMEGVTTLFTRLVPAMKEYGYNTESAMSVTRAMAAALQISGATTAEMSSVMLQFSQAMAAGRLNGAEFNAVAEGAPIVLRALSEALGVSRGALKKMAADGLLPTTVLTEVLKGKMEEWENQQKSMPLTVGKAWTSLTDSFSRFIGKMNEGVGVTGLIAKSIKLIGDNLSNITNTIAVGVVAWGTYSAAMMVYNMWLARSVALNTSLAASLGITTVATTAAAGATGLLSSAMAFLLANPIVLTLTAIAAAMGAIYLWTDKAATAQERFTELDTSGDKTGAMKVLAGEVERVSKEYDNLTVNMARLNKEREIAQRLGAGTSSQTAQLDALQKKLMSVAKGYSEALKALQDYKREQEKENVKQATEDLDKQIAVLEKEISLKRDLTDTEKKLDDATKSREALGERTDANKELFKSYDTQIVKLSKVIDLEKIRSNQKSASKTSKSLEESFDKKYDKLTEKLKLFIATQEEELGLRRKLTAAESEALKISEFIENNRSKMTAGEAAALDSARKRILLLGEQKVSQDKINTALDEYYTRIVEIANEESTAMSTSFKIKEDSLQRQQVLMNDIQGTQRSGLSLAYDAMEADKRKIQSINDQITKVWELKAAKLEAEGFEALARGDDVAVERITKAVEAVYKRIAALKLEKGVIAENTAELEKQAELLYQISQLNMAEIGRTPGDILAEGFGTAGKAISGMMESYDKFGEQSKRVNTELAGQLKHLAATGASPDKIAKVEQSAADKRMQINAQMYGSMAKSAKGFFNEQTKEYKTLEKVEKAFRALEMVMAVKSMVTQIMGIETVAAAEVSSVPTVVGAQQAKGTAAAATGVANQAGGDPYTAIPRMAAMVAIMAALGFVVSNINSSTGDPTEERQASQGTGTVLGDMTAKSESITNAIELIEENTNISAKYNEGMLAALKNIESALGGAAKMITRSQIGGSVDSDAGIDLGTMSQNSYMGKVTTNFVDKLADIDASLKKYLLPMLGGDALKKIFGVKVSVKDTGIFAQAQTVSDILEKGFSGESFTTVEKKARFRKAKQEEIFGELAEDVEKQFGLVIKSFHGGLQEVSNVLNVDGEDFSNRLNNFVVDIGRISLEGLSGEEVQKQLTAIFSKLGDEMALAAIPGLDNFQNIGEGYLETLIRVASTVATVDGIFKEIGQTFGVVGIEGVDAKMKLIELAGGLQELSNLVGEFYENFYTEAERNAITVQNLKEQFAALNVPMIDLSKESARIDFRNLVNGYKETNTEVYLALLKLAPAFASVTPEIDKATGAVVNMTEALKTATEKAKGDANAAMAVLEKSVNAQKSKAKTAYDDNIKYLRKTREDLVAAQKIERDNLETHLNSLEDSRIAAVNSQIQFTETSLDSIKQIRDNLKTVFDDISGAIDNLIGGSSTLQSVSYAVAQGQLNSIITSGIIPDSDSMKGMLSVLTGVDSSMFSSSFQMQQAKLSTAGKLADLKGIVGSQLSQKDATVRLMEQQLTALNSMTSRNDAGINATLEKMDIQHGEDLAVIDEQIKKAEEEYNSYIGRLDGILQTAKDSLDIAYGTFIATTDVASAVNSFNSSLQAYLSAKDAELAAKQSESESQRKEIEMLREDLRSANRVIALNTQQTAKILSQWDGDGQPELRNVQ